MARRSSAFPWRPKIPIVPRRSVLAWHGRRRIPAGSRATLSPGGGDNGGAARAPRHWRAMSLDGDEEREVESCSRMRCTRLVLVRHGHIERHGAMCGQTDVPLTPLGERQAAALGKRHLRAEVVYASPLRRARETARWLTEDVRCEPGLQEICCGRLEGAQLAAIQREYPDLWAAHEAQDDDDFRWPGGESYRELRERCVRLHAAIAARHAGQRVVIVTHAGVITQVIGHLTGTPPARWSRFRVGNTSITELDWAGERGSIQSFDVRDHLEPALQT